MITIEDLFESYYECRCKKRKTYNALEYESNYEVNLVQLYNEIIERKYEIGNSIAFIVTNPNVREVFAADFRDRIVHHLVIRKINHLFENNFIDDTYNCRLGKGTLKGILAVKDKIKECSENYTRSCYIVKCDLKGFFMSISKTKLWNLIRNFLIDNYDGDKEDLDILLYLSEKIIMHNPELKCIKKSPYKLWAKLDPDKSLFTNGIDYGEAIGNLPSQIFANFYLNEFDHLMISRHKYYARYVDDFVFIDTDKDKLLQTIYIIRKFLKDKLGVKLHPKKLYIQYYLKGVKFTGTVIKGKLLYVGSRTVGNFINKINEFNKYTDEEIKDNAEHFVCSINSYLGYLIHYNSFAIRCKLLKLIDKRWFKVCYIEHTLNKIICREEYKQINIIKDKLSKERYLRFKRE